MINKDLIIETMGGFFKVIGVLTIILVILVFLMPFVTAPQPEQPEYMPTGILPESIYPTPTQTIPPEPTPEKITVLVDQYSVNVHTTPELSAPVVGWVYSGQVVTVLVCRSGWAFIVSPEISGWSNGTCFSPNPCGDKGSCQ